MPLFAVLTYADVSAPSVPPLQHHGQEPAADIWAGADVRMTCRLRPDDVVAIRSGIEHDGAASPGPRTADRVRHRRSRRLRRRHRPRPPRSGSTVPLRQRRGPPRRRPPTIRVGWQMRVFFPQLRASGCGPPRTTLEDLEADRDRSGPSGSSSSDFRHVSARRRSSGCRDHGFRTAPSTGSPARLSAIDVADTSGRSDHFSGTGLRRRVHHPYGVSPSPAAAAPIRVTASVRTAWDVAKLSRVWPAPPGPNTAPELNATRPRS